LNESKTSNEIIKCILSNHQKFGGDVDLVSMCIYGSKTGGYGRRNSDYDILMILSNYPDAIRYHHPYNKKFPLSILTVDKELFEMDVTNGSLGEFVAGRILSPYEPLINSRYLETHEINLKTRIIIEELRDLVIQYGELSRGMRIKIEFVILSRFKKRIKTYPPLKYSYLNLFRYDLKNKNLRLMKRGFNLALIETEKKGIIESEADNFRITDGFIDKILKRKHIEKAINVIDFSRRALHSYIAHGRAGRVSLDILARELTAKINRELNSSRVKNMEIPDSRSYLYLKTAKEYVNVNERNSINEIIKSFEGECDISIKSLGGALNEVYLAKVGKKNYVIKKFSDWYGFKWFTLNLVALGTKYFSVSGKARLSNEYGISNYLEDNRFTIQKIFHINFTKRTLVKEYIKGLLLSDAIKNFKDLQNKIDLDDIFVETGKLFSNLHDQNIVLGDSKPENLIFNKKGDIITLDLEQSKKGGNKSWDIAEFLYYSGHYFGLTRSIMKRIAESFIDGYCIHGNPDIVKKSASLNYSKVFSFWTPPMIIYVISNTLRKH
jgi:tRNA A-37 threonylcarbamoyl transferase component Bud32